MFSLRFRRPPSLVPRPLRFDVPERLLASGEVLEPLDLKALKDRQDLAKSGVRAVAVCYLHSYGNPEHEQKTAKSCAMRCPAYRFRSRTRSSRNTANSAALDHGIECVHHAAYGAIPHRS